MARPDFKNVMPAEAAESLWSFPFAKHLALFWETIFGNKLWIEVPEWLSQYETDLWDSILLAATLKEKGIIDTLSRRQSEYADEVQIPFRYLVRVKSEVSGPGWNGVGNSFIDEKQALVAAIGEALERYSIAYFLPEAGKYIDASFEKIRSQALDIFSLAGTSPEERNAKNSALPLYFNQKIIFRWMPGYSLTQERPLLVPLQLVTSAYRPWRTGEEPLLRIFVSTGAATGATFEDAVYRGICEVIERDAYMITWLNKLSPPKLDLESIDDSRFQKVLESFKRNRLELKITILPTDLPVHVLLALIIDRTGAGPAVVATGDASLSFMEALWGAVTEAASLRLEVRNHFEHATQTGEEFGFQDLSQIGRKGRLLLWARKGMEREIEFLLKGKEIKTEDFPDFLSSRESAKTKMDFIAAAFKKEGLEAAAVDLTPVSIKSIPLKIVFVVAPQLQPMHLEEALPYFWGERLKTVPQKLGYPVSPMINKLPHPFP